MFCTYERLIIVFTCRAVMSKYARTTPVPKRSKTSFDHFTVKYGPPASMHNIDMDQMGVIAKSLGLHVAEHDLNFTVKLSSDVLLSNTNIPYATLIGGVQYLTLKFAHSTSRFALPAQYLKTRCILIYSGTHYDRSPDTDITIWPTTDSEILEKTRAPCSETQRRSILYGYTRFGTEV